MSKARSDSTSHLSAVVTGTIVIVALYFAKEILLPFALAVLLSFLLTPLVRRLERLGAPRVPAVLVVACLAFSVIGLTAWVVTDQVVELSAKLPEYKGNLISKVRAVSGATRGKIDEATDTIKEISEELTVDDESEEQANTTKSRETLTGDEPKNRVLGFFVDNSTEAGEQKEKDEAVEVKVVALPPSPLEQVQTWLGPLVAPLTTGGVVVVLTLFMSLKREDMRNRIIQLVGTAHLRATTEALDEATRRVSDFLRMQLVINAIYGVCVGTGLYLIGVPNAFLWGVLGLLLRFLPYIGPWLVFAMPLTLSLAVFDDWGHLLMTIGLFVTLELIVNNVLEPWLYGASMGISSVGIICAAIFWTWLWGPIGLVIAMPLTVCLVVAGNYIPRLRFLTVLLGDRATLTIEERFYQRLLALDDEEADRLIADYLQQESREQLYDDVLIPALCLAERDRHDGVLTEQQEAIVLETTRELVEQLEDSRLADTEHTGDNDTSVSDSSVRVLCVPGRDQADEVTATMLCQLLAAVGIQAETQSNDALAAELVEYAKTEHADIVVISAVPPGATRHARYLCKRLRAQLPKLPIMVGLWSGSQMTRTHKRLNEVGATLVATSLTEAVKQVQSMSRLDRHSAAPHTGSGKSPAGGPRHPAAGGANNKTTRLHAKEQEK